MSEKRRRPLWQKLLAGLFGIVAMFVVAFVWMSNVAKSNLNVELKKMQALGYAITLDEFKKRLPPDDETNAAPIYYRAMEVYGGLGAPVEETKDAKGRRDPHKRASFVMITEPVYPLIVQGSQKSNCVFTRNWDEGIEMPFDEMKHFKQFVAILRDRAEHNGLLGKWQQSLDDLSIGLRVSGHVRQDPTLIGHLAAIATEMMVIRSFVGVCASNSDYPKFREAAKKWLASAPPPPDRKRALDFEIAGVGRFIEQMADPKVAREVAGEEADKFVGAAVRFYMGTASGRNTIHATYLREVHKALEPPYENPHADIPRWIELDDRMNDQRRVAGKLASMFSPDLGDIAKAFARAVDLRRLAAASLWVMEQRATSGALPSGLPHEERFRDLYIGEPYVLTKTESGFRLLSYGPNQVDDGGKAGRESGADDIKLDVDLTAPNPWRRR